MRKEKGSARSHLKEQPHKDQGKDWPQEKGPWAGCSAQLSPGRRRDIVCLSPARFGQRQVLAAAHSFRSCSLPQRESLAGTVWESQCWHPLQLATRPMPLWHHMEQPPHTFNANLAISIAIWQGKDYEIKITTKTPLVTMFSGGSGLKDKMENNQLKTSTLFFSVCFGFFVIFFFLNSYLIIITLWLSSIVHLWTDSMGKQHQKFQLDIQSNCISQAWVWTLNYLWRSAEEEPLTVSDRINFWHTEANYTGMAQLHYCPVLLSSNLGDQSWKAGKFMQHAITKKEKNIIIYLRNQQQY